VSKEKDQSPEKHVSRRRAMKTLASAIPAAAAGGAIVGAAAGQSPTQLKQFAAAQDQTFAKQLAAVQEHKVAVNKLKLLSTDPKCLKQYLDMVDEVVQSMLKDPKVAAQVLGHIDSVLLVNLFDANRREIEPVIGKVNGRSVEGRYRKIIHATELIEDVSGFDSSGLLHGAEEIGGFQNISVSSSSSSSCSGCDAGGSSFLGCCIIHFWGWSASDSGCSPCGPGPVILQS